MSENDALYYAPVSRVTGETALLNDLQKAINGEFSAISCYEKMIKMAPNEEVKSRVTEIRRDEIRHFNTFQHLYDRLTGQPFPPKVSEACPNNYAEALRFAFNDEQKTVDFYNELASSVQDQEIMLAFGRAARDEQNHAVWFLYFLTK